MRVFRALLLLLGLVATAAAGAKEKPFCPNWHLGDAAPPIAHRSDFTHGYLHGYEAGFHMGDQDVHIGRDMGDAQGAFKRMPDGKKMRRSGKFRNGFEEGFRAGYGDAFSGRRFRAIDTLRAIASPAVITDRNRAAFDSGMVNGYAMAVAGEQNRLQAHMDRCESSVPGGGKDAAYCDGLRRGAKLGGADAAFARDTATHARSRGKQ